MTPKQTAVEWLVDKVIEYQQKDLKISKNFDRLLIANAKEIEKQQIIKTFYDCKLSIITKEPITAEQYYTENYESNR